MTSPDFDIDYADGAQGELFVSDLRAALAAGRVEVKTDRRFIETGNIYVESACRYPQRGWRQTGIANPDTADLWIYVLKGTGVGVVFERDVLRRVAYDPRCSWDAQERDGGHPTTGRLIRLGSAMRPSVLR